jgi:phospho-N-acetylmuramoyl-pentapeptide-transferase
MTLSLIKLFLPVLLTFIIGILITPFFTGIFYKYRMWKKVPRHLDGESKKDEMSAAFKALGTDKMEMHTPRVGGLIIWVSVVISAIILFLVAYLNPTDVTTKLNFVSKNQTYLPFAALLIGALFGLVNDLMTIYIKKGAFVNGFPRRYMIGFVALVGLVFATWFYSKLGVDYVELPLTHHLSYLGLWFIPFFTLVFMATFSSGVIDGIDGLAGGVMAIIFASLSAIAFFQNQIDIAAFALVISGAILAFLWFNIPPARFWMGETGMLGLMFALVVIVFLTDTVLIFPILAFPLVITSASSFIQIISKKLRGPIKGKIFRIAPLHHHFEAIGWSREKITMRYWILSLMFAVVGVIVALL